MSDAGELRRGSDETILLVEDDGSVRRALAMLLQNNGYNVLAAESGEAALAEWDKVGGRIDLAITDLVMAGMTGGELATILSERRPGLAILVMSGHSADIDPRLAKYEVLHKPFSSDTLLAAVRACIDNGGKPRTLDA